MSFSTIYKKSVLLIALFLVFASNSLLSADLELTKVDTLVSKSTADYELESYAIIKNISNKSIDILVRNEIMQLAEGHTTSFCFGTDGKCFQPSTANTVSDVTLTLAPGASSKKSDYKGYVFTNDGVGITKVKYIFYDANNESSQVSYTTVFDALPMSVDKELSAKVNVFPNPVSSYLKIDGVNLGVNYRIFTSIGVEVASGMLMSNLLDLSNLNTGAYTILINGNIAKEFLIQR